MQVVTHAGHDGRCHRDAQLMIVGQRAELGRCLGDDVGQIGRA